MKRKNKVICDKLQQISNIWAMIAAASVASAFFSGSWFIGPVLGIYSTYMSLFFIDLKHQVEKEDEEGE